MVSRLFFSLWDAMSCSKNYSFPQSSGTLQLHLTDAAPRGCDASGFCHFKKSIGDYVRKNAADLQGLYSPRDWFRRNRSCLGYIIHQCLDGCTLITSGGCVWPFQKESRVTRRWRPAATCRRSVERIWLFQAFQRSHRRRPENIDVERRLLGGPVKRLPFVPTLSSYQAHPIIHLEEAPYGCVISN